MTMTMTMTGMLKPGPLDHPTAHLARMGLLTPGDGRAAAAGWAEGAGNGSDAVGAAGAAGVAGASLVEFMLDVARELPKTFRGASTGDDYCTQMEFLLPLISARALDMPLQTNSFEPNLFEACRTPDLRSWNFTDWPLECDEDMSCSVVMQNN